MSIPWTMDVLVMPLALGDCSCSASSGLPQSDGATGTTQHLSMNGQIAQPSVMPGLQSSIVARPFCTQQPRHRRVSLVCSAERHDHAQPHVVLNRRQLLASALAVAAVQAAPASAYTPPPAGASPCRRSRPTASLRVLVHLFRRHEHTSCGLAGKRRNVDVLDGYSFLYPEDWAAVTVSIRTCCMQSDGTTFTRLARRTSAAVSPEQSDRHVSHGLNATVRRRPATTSSTATPTTWRRTCLSTSRRRRPAALTAWRASARRSRRRHGCGSSTWASLCPLGSAARRSARS